MVSFVEVNKLYTRDNCLLCSSTSSGSVPNKKDIQYMWLLLWVMTGTSVDYPGGILIRYLFILYLKSNFQTK